MLWPGSLHRGIAGGTWTNRRWGQLSWVTPSYRESSHEGCVILCGLFGVCFICGYMWSWTSWAGEAMECEARDTGFALQPSFFCLVLVALGLCCCSWAFWSCTERWATLGCGAGASHCSGFSCCSTWAREHRLTSCGVWLSCSPQHMGSSQTRDQTCVPCLSRQILNHWTSRKVPAAPFLTSQHDLGPCCYLDPQCPPGNLVERMMWGLKEMRGKKTSALFWTRSC